MNVIVLMIDRWNAGFLGAYGNTWIETPAIDRWAADSCVFAHCLVDSPRLDRVYRSYWLGLHAMCARPQLEAGRPSLAALLRSRGIATALLTDEESLLRIPAAADFDECVAVESSRNLSLPRDVMDTQAARTTMAALTWLEAVEGPFALWCHFGALGRVWDAPPSLREMYREEGDPPPLPSVEPPDRLLEADADPDEAWAAAMTYAAQVSVLDQCLGAFDQFIREARWADDTALILTACRGYPLGEHRRIGGYDELLYGETVHVPLILRLPRRTGALLRKFELVEPSDIWATALALAGCEGPPSPTAVDLLGLVAREEPLPRDRLCIVGSGQRAIRTPAWFMRRAGRSELYVKPDDFWEANDVAVRCPEIVERLEEAIVEFDQAVQFGSVFELPPLPPELRAGLE